VDQFHRKDRLGAAHTVARETAEFAKEQFETYDRLAKSLGIELK